METFRSKPVDKESKKFPPLKKCVNSEKDDIKNTSYRFLSCVVELIVHEIIKNRTRDLKNSLKRVDIPGINIFIIFEMVP